MHYGIPEQIGIYLHVHMLGTIGQSNTYVFLLPFTKQLYVGACVPCFPVPALVLVKVPILACSAQHLFFLQSQATILQCAIGKRSNHSPTWMSYEMHHVMLHLMTAQCMPFWHECLDKECDSWHCHVDVKHNQNRVASWASTHEPK